MTPEICVELQHLLSALVEHEITDAEHIRLEELLRADPACVQVYLEYVDMHAKMLADASLQSLGSTPTPHGSVQPTANTDTQATPSSAPVAAAPTERPYWLRRNLRQACLILGTLAASILVQIFWNLIATVPEPARPEAVAPMTEKRPYVATLVSAKDYDRAAAGERWRDGSRLAAGKLIVPKGIFNIRLDSGAELIVEGPAMLNVESSTAVAVHSGKVVVRGTESETPFDLRTPTSTLVDVNTEFGVFVDDEGEEVHVFEGEVQRVAKSVAAAEPENLKAGDARRYDAEANARPPRFDGKHFVRHVHGAGKVRPDQPSGLLAHENFVYSDPYAMQKGKADGGFGWDGPWKATFARSYPKGELHKTPLNIKECLARRGTPDVVEGGSFDFVGFAASFRKLAKPVRLDADQVYFLSFAFRRHGSTPESFNSVALLLWTNDDFYQKDLQDIRKRLYIGVTGSNLLYSHFQRMTARTSMPLVNGETYLLVAKIAASQSHPDQVFLRVYGPQETIESTETGTWSVQSTSFRSDHVFHWVELHINSKTRQTIDQIRIGSTWQSVTSSEVK